MSSEKLYQILSEDQPKEIPWTKAAAQFVKLKMASGGLLPEEIEELHALAKQAQEAKPTTISKEELEQAVKKGIISGTRGNVRGDISHAGDVHRKRGENISKNVGALGGAAAGGLAGHKLVGGPVGTIGGAALGAVLGRGVGKTVGQEVDRARVKSKMHHAVTDKGAEIEKASDFEQEKQAFGILIPIPKPPLDPEEGERGGKVIGTTLGGLGGALTGGGLGYAHGMRKVLSSGYNPMGHMDVVPSPNAKSKALLGALALGTAGAVGGHYLGAVLGRRSSENRREHEMSEMRKRLEMLRQLRAEEEALHPHQLPETDRLYQGEQKLGEARVLAKLMAKKAMLLKHGQEGDEIPVEYLHSMEQPSEEEQVPPELEEFLQAQQQANEAEFFRQKAEEAAMAASQANERADLAEGEAMQAQQQTEMQAQDTAMKEQATQQQTMLAQEQAQMASQDSVNARNESLAAQQQNIQLRQAVTSFRQQLMDLVSQDPTMMMPPPAVPEGPMPGAEEAAAGPPQEAGPPGAEGMPPGAPPGMPPGAEMAGPPPGAEMAPPGPPAPPQGPPGMPKQMKPPAPPAGPPAPPMG